MKVIYSILSLVAICFLSVSLSAQSKVTKRLEDKLKSADGAAVPVRIEFYEEVDCYALNAEFRNGSYNLDQRARITMRKLKKQAERSQLPIVDFLERHHPSSLADLQRFWIVNIIVLKADESTVSALEDIPSIRLLDLEDNRIEMHEAIIKSESLASRQAGGGVRAKTSTPGGVEPGLEAINARPLWDLGYTGRGRLVYNYDTGVWPQHPAFKDRFMANFYPLSQSWFGFFSQLPNGNVQNHGTHTLGTIAGLDTATSDTIGVAFGSYWIANDYVTSTVGALPPITEMIKAFEWALNPDGDTMTSFDIPDVINNSWRWYDDPDTLYCGGLVVNLMNAIEAVGIANVFSGGNFGPSNTTISSPQRINTSDVNTFSVGSVNGNGSFPYPISNFSSRGPKQCPGTGSLSIHPEVVAPGQNVRSAWGTDSYNTISGTSMAAPHVSGAVLLLKEAFPNLPGEELLMALYSSAVDMGPVGEDNTYGNGMIDVYAAYQYLQMSHTPVDPNAIPWDLAIISASAPGVGGISCDSGYAPLLVLGNYGDSTITNVSINYTLNGGVSLLYNWTGSLAPGAVTNVQLPWFSFSHFGDHELLIRASLGLGKDEYDLYNNNRAVRFNRRQSVGVPFVEDYEQGFDPALWLIDNEDGADSWDTLATAGLNGDHSATVQMYNYGPRDSQRDGLIGPEISLPAAAQQLTLKFDLAYQRLNTFSALQDTFKVFLSTDCGATFPNKIYEQSGAGLSTTDSAFQDFVPFKSKHWRRDSVDLQSWSGQDILLKFETVNRQGNNIYLDNVVVYEGAQEPVSLRESTLESVKVYPNPFSDNIQLEIPNSSEELSYELEIFNAVNQRVLLREVRAGEKLLLNTSDWGRGMYVIRLSDGKRQSTERMIRF